MKIMIYINLKMFLEKITLREKLHVKNLLELN